MRCHLIISHAIWPDAAESARIGTGLLLPALAMLAGRGRRETFVPAPTRDWLGQCFGLADFPAAPLLLASVAPHEQSGYWLRADPVHLAINQHGAEMADPAALAISQDEATQLLAALNAIGVQPLVDSAPSQAQVNAEIAFTIAMLALPLAALFLVWRVKVQGFSFSGGLRGGMEPLAVFTSLPYTVCVLFLMGLTVYLYRVG